MVLEQEDIVWNLLRTHISNLNESITGNNVLVVLELHPIIAIIKVRLWRVVTCSTLHRLLHLHFKELISINMIFT